MHKQINAIPFGVFLLLLMAACQPSSVDSSTQIVPTTTHGAATTVPTVDSPTLITQTPSKTPRPTQTSTSTPTPFSCPETGYHNILDISDIQMLEGENPLEFYGIEPGVTPMEEVCDFLASLGVSLEDDPVYFHQSKQGFSLSLVFGNAESENGLLEIGGTSAVIQHIEGYGFPYIERFSIQHVLERLGNSVEIRVAEGGMPNGVSILLYYPEYHLIYRMISHNPELLNNFCLANTSRVTVEFYFMGDEDSARYILESFGYDDFYQDFAQKYGMSQDQLIQHLVTSSYCEP